MHVIQWNPSIAVTIGNKHFVPCSEVPNSGASGIFLVQAVEHNVAAFSELFFAVHWQGRLSRGWYYMSESANLMSSFNPAAMVNNLSEKLSGGR